MDERLEKAFQTANFMAALTSQRKLALEEFQQSLIYYQSGASFTITRDLMSFVKMLIDAGYTEDTVLIDDNNMPVQIKDLQEFFNNILDQYYQGANQYYTKYADLKKQRKVEDLIKYE
jgi:hypothetical protein